MVIPNSASTSLFRSAIQRTETRCAPRVARMPISGVRRVTHKANPCKQHGKKRKEPETMAVTSSFANCDSLSWQSFQSKKEIRVRATESYDPPFCKSFRRFLGVHDTFCQRRYVASAAGRIFVRAHVAAVSPSCPLPRVTLAKPLRFDVDSLSSRSLR